MNGHRSLSFYTARLKERALAQKQPFVFCCCAVFLWGLLAHAYGFLHNILSHDVLNAFIATQTEENWKIELGRFFVPVYRTIFRGAVSLPWLLGLMGLLWTSVSVFLTVKILNVRSKLLTVLIAGVMTTNITNIAQIATYIYEFDINCFALMLSVMAAFIWDRKKSIWHLAAAAGLVFVSIGLYQAYFAVTVTLMVWKSVMELFAERDIKAVIARGLQGIAALLVGCILYVILGKIVYAVSGVPASGRTNVFDLQGGIVFQYLRLIKPALGWFVDSILHQSYYSVPYALAVAALTGSMVVLSVCFFVRKKFEIKRVLLICLLVLLTPFAMACIYFISKGQNLHDLTKFSLWLFFVFMAQFAFWLAGEFGLPGKPARLVRLFSCGLVLLILWQNVVLANTAYVKKELEANAALSTMTRVVTVMEQQKDYVPKETPVAFIGVSPYVTRASHMDRVKHITGMRRNAVIPSDASEYYYNAYKAYFEYVLRYPIVLCTDEIHAQLKEDPRVLEMPVYPAEGCMQIIDGVLIVKLGE